MSLIILNNDLNDNNLAKDSSIALLNEFGENYNVIEFTNVFQLRVKKAQYHLSRLKASIDAKTCITKDKEVSNIVNHSSLQDKFGILSEVFVVKSVYLNPGQLISLSEVLQETCGIVGRLEEDRINVQLNVDKQMIKVNEILRKIEDLSFFRMEMLPAAVQKEHEACSNDIYELQWHIKHRSKIEMKIREKRNKAEDINNQLKEEINEIKEYIPLVEEKLILERDMLLKIEETKQELSKESDISAERMQVTKSKHDDCNKKADAERQHIKRELHNSNKILTKTQKSLEHGIKEHLKMEDFKLRAEVKIRDNHQEIARLNSENSGKMTEQNIYQELVGVLESRMRETLFDKRRLTDERDKKQNDLEEQEKEQNEILGALKNKRDDLDQEMTILRRNNKQTEIEIDSIKASIEKCVLDTNKTRERIETTKMDIIEAEKEFDVGIEDFTTESRKHSSVKQRLTEVNREIQESEDKLRKSLKEIESQIKQEIMMKASVRSKMTTDAGDLEKSKKESSEKQNQMKKALKESLSLMSGIKLKVAEVESQHKKSSEELQALLTQNAKILAEQEALRAERSARINELTPIHDNLKARIDLLVQKEEHVQWQIRTMNSQLLEMSASEKLITNAKKKMLETLLGIERDHNHESVELDMTRRYGEKLTTSISHTVSRCSRMRSTHTKYIREREEDLIVAKKEFEQSLRMNGDLAKQYRSSQTDFYGMQDAYLNVVQEHLWEEESVKDMKEIQRLQRHMHNCMDAFFTMKVMYDEDQLKCLQQKCGRNLDKIELLKRQYTDRIEGVKSFLVETFPNESQLISDNLAGPD